MKNIIRKILKEEFDSDSDWDSDWDWAINTPTDILLEFMGMNNIKDLRGTVLVFTKNVGNKLLEYQYVLEQMGFNFDGRILKISDLKILWFENDYTVNWSNHDSLEVYLETNGYGIIEGGYSYETFDGAEKQYKILKNCDYLLQ